MIISLDVGFRNTGWVVFNKHDMIVDCGVIMTEKSKKNNVRIADDYSLRASQLALSLKALVEKYQAKVMIGELPVGGARSARAMAQMGMANAVVSSVCALLNLPTDWATPTAVKLAVCGTKNATKEEIMRQIRKLYPEYNFIKQKGIFEHIADAVGVYIALKDVSSIIKIFKNTTN